MNKQLINKYKHEFDHWLNEGSVLIKSDLGWCPIAKEFAWSCNISVDALLVINDEFVEFRKALAEGKTIQSTSEGLNYYCDILNPTPSRKFSNYLHNYRIKSDEHKFKVSDFVTPLNREINCSIWQIDNILSCNTLVSGSTMLDPRTVQLWMPIKGEWCWFYDNPNKDKYCNLSQFEEESNGRYFRTMTNTPWNFCEPFLNSLPSYLKDK